MLASVFTLCSDHKSKVNFIIPISDTRKIVPLSLHSARVVFQLILIEGRRKEAGLRAQSWELSREQGEHETEVRRVSRTVRGNMGEVMPVPGTLRTIVKRHPKTL